MMIMAVLSLHQEGIEERSRSGASMEEITDHPVSSTGAVVEAGVAAASSSPAVEAPMAVSPRPPPASPAARYQEEEEDEGDVCRICRIPGDAENPLRYPCACSGSIKFVHQDCLLQWLNHSNARQCEVCKHAFSFSPVYAENAPARLPFQEFVVGMAMKACHVLQFFVRLAFVLSVWLLIIPFITFWIWRLTFVRSLGEAQRLFLSHISAPLILTDCLHGFLLSASIVFIFLGATSLRDYFRHIRDKVKECKYAACKEIVRHAQNFQESNSLANLKHHVRVPEYSFDDTVIVNHDHNSEDEAALETTTSSDGSDIDENVCCKGEEESGTDG